MAFPWIMQLIVDRGIQNKDINFIIILLIAQSADVIVPDIDLSVLS